MFEKRLPCQFPFCISGLRFRLEKFNPTSADNSPDCLREQFADIDTALASFCVGCPEPMTFRTVHSEPDPRTARAEVRFRPSGV